MRTRSDNLVKKTYNYPGCIWESWSNTNPPVKTATWSSVPYSDAVVEETSSTMTDVVTKDYKKKVAQGQIINNPMTKTTTTNYKNFVEYDWSWENYENGLLKSYGFGIGPRVSDATFICGAAPACPTLNRQSLIDRAVASAHASCDLSEVAILATLGEGKETILSIFQILRRVYNIYRAIRKLDLKVLRNEVKLKEVADRYMEYRYALRPLYYDAKQICNAYTADVNKVHDRQTFRGYAEDVITDKGDYSLSLSDYRTSTVTYSHTKKISVRAGVLCQITSSSRGMTWGAFNIPQTMWELMPFSFIFDWFLNIGDVINSFSPKAGLNELASWAVVEEITALRQEGILSGVNTPNKKTMVAGAVPALVSQYTCYKERIVNPPRGILPRVDINLDSFKLLDLGIILNKLRK